MSKNKENAEVAPVEIVDLTVPLEFYSTRDKGFFAKITSLCHQEVEAKIQVNFIDFIHQVNTAFRSFLKVMFAMIVKSCTNSFMNIASST